MLVAVIFCFTATNGVANIWIDENFDGTSIWVQGDGAGDTVSPSNATLDIYSWDALNDQLSTVLTETGAKVTTKFFDGTACYEIASGETIAVGTPYESPANGAFVILQFGVNVDPIPSSGDVGIFRFDWDTDSTTGASPDYSFYVKLVSTGSAVDIIAGEDVANSPASEATIGTLSTTSDWKFITMVMQNNNTAETYPATNLPADHTLENVAEGVSFYCSSKTAGHTVAMTGNGDNKTGVGWDITVSSGTVYIDTLYWEGGMDNTDSIDDTDEAMINIRPFDYTGSGSAVRDWLMY